VRPRLTRAQRDHGAFTTRRSDYSNEAPEQEGPPVPPHIEEERARRYFDGAVQFYPWEADSEGNGQ
jgi:hypothetical protein